MVNQLINAIILTIIVLVIIYVYNFIKTKVKIKVYKVPVNSLDELNSESFHTGHQDKIHAVHQLQYFETVLYNPTMERVRKTPAQFSRKIVKELESKRTEFKNIGNEILFLRYEALLSDIKEVLKNRTPEEDSRITMEMIKNFMTSKNERS